MLFSKFFSRKDENSPAFKREMAEKVNNKLLRCVVSRENGIDTIVAKSGHISMKDETITVYGQQGEAILRESIYDVKISELMSLEGAIFISPKINATIIAYYKYYRENL